MAKRFIDTNFYKSPFVRSLKAPLKSLYVFIICDCNGAGIWNIDLEVAEIYTGFKISFKEFVSGFVETGKAVDLNNGRYFFPDFLEHQYPNGLQNNNKAHKNFITELLKYQLIDENLKPLQRGLEASKVMVKVMVKEKVMVNNDENSQKKLDLPHGEEFKKTWELLLRQRNWKKKGDNALNLALKKLSLYDEGVAIKMMENTIEGEWKGLFEIKGNVKQKAGPKELLKTYGNVLSTIKTEKNE